MLSLSQIWLILAGLALIAEFMSVGFVFIFFSIGGLVTALLSWIGIANDITSQVICFSIVSIGSLLLLRKPLQDLFRQNGHNVTYSEYLGDVATVIKDIPASGEGRVFFRGTEWIALSEKNVPIVEGSKVIIKQLDGIKLIVS